MNGRRRGEEMPAEKSSGGDDRVGTLIRLAGPRPAVPAESTRRVETAVREAWLHQVRQRSRRRRLWTVTAMAAAAMVTLAVVASLRWQPTPAPDSVLARAEMVAGPAWMRDGEGEAALSTVRIGAGDALLAGAELATPEDGRLALRLASGHSVRLDVNTRLRLMSRDSLALDSGRIYIDSGPSPGPVAQSLEIQTSLGVVREIGTQFEVLSDGDSLRVRVREGAVHLGAGAEALEVAAGSEIQRDARGRTHRRRLDTFSAEWAWVGNVTPMMDLEGRSLREFVDWVARERGWHVDYGNESFAASASGIMLNGSVEGLGLDEVLGAVLPTCGADYRVDDGILLVESATGGEPGE